MLDSNILGGKLRVKRLYKTTGMYDSYIPSIYYQLNRVILTPGLENIIYWEVEYNNDE